MLGSRQRLIALHVHVNVSLDDLRNFVDAVGTAAMLRRSKATRPAISAADCGNLFRICRHDDVLQLRTGAGRVIDMSEHRATVDLAQDLPGQSRGRKPRWNDCDCFHLR